MISAPLKNLSNPAKPAATAQKSLATISKADRAFKLISQQTTASGYSAVKAGGGSSHSVARPTPARRQQWRPLRHGQPLHVSLVSSFAIIIIDAAAARRRKP